MHHPWLSTDQLIQMKDYVRQLLQLSWTFSNTGPKTATAYQLLSQLPLNTHTGAAKASHRAPGSYDLMLPLLPKLSKRPGRFVLLPAKAYFLKLLTENVKRFLIQ